MNTAVPQLVSHHLCPYVQRAVITASEKGIAHERVYVDLADKPRWFREVSPLGRVPLLRVGETVLFESAVIAEYLDEVSPGSLHPADPLERARHRAWIEFASAMLADIAAFYNARDEDEFQARCGLLRARFGWLERHLGEGPYFAGERFTLVDAAFAPAFRYFEVFARLGDFAFFDHTPRVSRYRGALAARASVVAAVGADYAQRLLAFIARRGGRLAAMVDESAAA